MSGAGDDTIIGIRDHVSRLEEQITDHKKRSKVPQSSTTHKKNTQPTIGKVPGSNKKKHKKYYKPSEMSIGPIHLRDYPRDHYKHGLARKFIQENEIKEIDACKKILDNIKHLRECYDREVKLPKADDELVWILFLDGCSTLGFIQDFSFGDLRSFRINNNQISLIKKDLFLLENQLPLRVLVLLIDLSKNKRDIKTSIKIFIRWHSFVPINSSWIVFLDYDEREEEKGNEKPAHLLDLLRLAADWPVSTKAAPKVSIGSKIQPYRLASVQELKWSGIQCRRSSKPFVTFSSSKLFAGYLHIPPITVLDDTTKIILMNLVAYETRGDTGCEVSTYIWFLNSLMNHAEDVKELRSSRILYTNIGSDEKLVKFFSEIPTDLVPPLDHLDVLSELPYHINKRRGRWMAEAWYKYFDSPWTIIALIAGGLALFLTTAQTWFTVFRNQ